MTVIYIFIRTLFPILMIPYGQFAIRPTIEAGFSPWVVGTGVRSPSRGIPRRLHSRAPATRKEPAVTLSVILAAQARFIHESPVCPVCFQPRTEHSTDCKGHHK
ncbi:hypothetical protein SEA_NORMANBULBIEJR_87 [Mycobacterium phage NormanBulbieJr]|uniref:Uncharacterized protein n=1 Tax=Mycobacterium phage Priscilla TaxID=2081627 RepID=A0A2P1A2U2_9CAUD|nr:hypothetical protein I5H82_gp089 [Mycobacterium phage Priscilla]AVI04343.1 hypothetical protein SEA_PRISCILLA_89 [Mycobacterium phage Priscilla]AWY03701.1 hypothetical protein SEA_KOELLA_81 [Mycobacterium phage Koella]AXC38365.1 hypothetical protein SEA_NORMANBULBIEJR_87 [Mycobacterium phage NormanBulbieJr]